MVDVAIRFRPEYANIDNKESKDLTSEIDRNIKDTNIANNVLTQSKKTAEEIIAKLEAASYRGRVNVKLIKEELENTVQEAKIVDRSLQQRVSQASATLSFVSGGVALLTAVSGNVQDQMISLVLTSASSSLGLISAYAAIGAASGNFALLAAAGAGLSSVATMINVVRNFGERNKAAREADERRLQNLKI